MKPTVLTLLAFAACAAAANAQGTAPEPTPPAGGDAPATAPATHDASPIVLAPRPAPAPAPRTATEDENRSVSPSLAAALADGMPRFSPPTPTPSAPAEEQDLRDVDKPRNEIPRLPKYVVRETRPPVFSQRDILTQEGLVNLSFKNHPGLRIGNFFGLNEATAKEMIYEDQRLANIQDLNETAYAMAMGGDRAEADYIHRATQDTFMRSDDSWNSGPAGTLLGGIGK